MSNKKIWPLLSCMLAFSSLISAQNITVRGSVTDSNNEPIIGATVVIEGSSQGTVTNIEGSYILSDVPHNTTLIFSYLGMESRRIEVNGRQNIDVILSEDSELLDEVVVIGYGSVRKKDLTGAVSQVNPRELNLAPVGSFDEALAGRIAGVQVISPDGQPGGSSSIVIRGASSLTQSNEPLYVIDGVAQEDPDHSEINPEEIASMTILKDASATSIYGSRAANGVVIIETKKGISAKPIITFSSSIGYQEPIKLMKMMSPLEFVKTQYEILPTTTARLYLPGELTEDDPYYKPDGRIWADYENLKGVNWQDQILNPQPLQKYNLSIRGRNGGTSYSVSGSIFDQNGIVESTGFKRYQGRITLNQELTKKANMGFSINYTKNERFGQRVNDGGGSHYSTWLLYRAWGYRPISANPDIDLLEEIDDPEYESSSDVRINPLISSQNIYDRNPSGIFSSNITLDYDITQNIKFRALGSYSNNNSSRFQFFNSRTTQAAPRNRWNTNGIYGSQDTRSIETISNENTLAYTQTFKDTHNLNVVGGMSYYMRHWDNFGYSSQHIPNEELEIYGFKDGIPYNPISGGGEDALLSFFGRVDYNYKSAYYVTASLRSDGSSKFPVNNRWGIFPSIAFSWDMKNDLFKNINFISASKLRLSYGLTGNNRVGEYAYLMRMDMPIDASYSFNNQTPIQGTVPAGLANEALKWETTTQSNIGLDIGLFNERASLTIDLYEKLTKDLLLNADVPYTTGQTRVMRNIGSMSNTGLEISLQTVNIHQRDFTWTSNFNISFNENKILGLTRNQNKLLTNINVIGQSSPLYISRVGYPAGMFFGYIFDGIYQVEDFDSPGEGVYILKPELPDNGTGRDVVQPGHIKYKDLNNDGTITADDMTIIGRGQPIHIGGFTNNFYYKGFSLNVFLQWSYGNQIYNANRMGLEGSQGLYGLNSFASYVDRWTPENRSNTLYTTDGYGPLGYQSNRVLEDGSYLRLKTLSLSYTLSKNILERLPVDNLTFTLSSQNLITWTNYSGMDPEVSGRDPILSPGYDYSSYPQARTYTLGFNLSF